MMQNGITEINVNNFASLFIKKNVIEMTIA